MKKVYIEDTRTAIIYCTTTWPSFDQVLAAKTLIESDFPISNVTTKVVSVYRSGFGNYIGVAMFTLPEGTMIAFGYEVFASWSIFLGSSFLEPMV